MIFRVAPGRRATSSYLPLVAVLTVGLAVTAMRKCTLRRLNLAPPQQMYDRLVAGGIAGAVSRTLVAPLERYAGSNAFHPIKASPNSQLA